ncbi:MAG: 6-phosphogluconolactonase [Actinomycetota bacterium]
MTVDIASFATREGAGMALADTVAQLLAEAVRNRGRATLAVPGGRSPVAFFDALFPQALPWERVAVTLTDDRWVPEDSPDSNLGQLRRHLAGARCRVVPLAGAEPTPSDGAQAAAERLAGLGGPFDAVVLGLGDDGHVASLFPGQPLDAAAPCLPGIAPVAPAARISLSLSRLLATRALFLLFGGSHRLGLVQAPPPGLPVTAVLEQAATTVRVIHYRD